ncbi:MAG TPA: AAA family ATPase [Thermoanaerobaculia bacterium]|nr:AAA family ATPase [Thermoanaerobaculia bacterium]
MLTRLKVTGFKNLVDADVSFGPFTCIAGVNGVGKSNLFDAIAFLGSLADKPFFEAASGVRAEGGRTDIRSLFHRAGTTMASEMSFEAEMLIPESGTDELNQDAKAEATFLRYRLVLGWDTDGLSLRSEELEAIDPRRADDFLLFPHTPEWRQSVVLGSPLHGRLISTGIQNGEPFVNLRQLLGHPLRHHADRLTGTVLSTATAALNPTVALARREMQGWRLLQLEPSALRAPDSFSSPRRIAANGAHLPATLARIAGIPSSFGRAASHQLSAVERESLYARIANRLAELFEGVRSVRVDVDERRELIRLLLDDRDGTEHEARALSDGILRFLALAILESDPEAVGVLCVEEPENGIHPERISSMLRLLRDLAVDPTEPCGADNPLRQVIVSTHSPIVASQVPDDSLLLAAPESRRQEGQSFSAPVFRSLSETWRARAFPEVSAVSLGSVLSYLNPVEPSPDRAGAPDAQRVIDREDIQAWMPSPTTEKP